MVDMVVKGQHNKSVDTQYGPGVFSLSGMSSPVEIVDQVISEAAKRGASDILLEPQEHEVAVRLRVDGVLQLYGTMSYGSYDQVLSRIKVLGNMDVTENRKPQEAKIGFETGDKHAYVLRAAVVSTNFGQMAALRVLDLPRFSGFTDLGLSNEMEEQIKKNVSGRYGLFLVCGPTGSGKTTTVHTCLKYLNTGGVNIMTIEDPIEYVIPGINQIEVGPEVGLDFAGGLRMLLRLNPDIVFVGEIRDSETAKIAVQASLTGHLVISTVHARNSVGAIYRLLERGVDRDMVNNSVRAILAQRLMRKICVQCKEEYSPDPDEIKVYERERGKPPGVLARGRGCEVCKNSQYKDRVGIFEMMQMDDGIRELVTRAAGETEFNNQLLERGFETMNDQGWKLVDGGATSLSEYIRIMFDAK